MFDAFLAHHPLRTLLAENNRLPYPPMCDRAAWDALPDFEREALLVLHESYRAPYPMLPATAFMAFTRTGDRLAWQTPYYFRRKKLIAAALCCCVTGTTDALDEVIDGLWCIFEESTWVISAHNGSSHEGQRPQSERILPDVQNPYIDLFAAQTGMVVSLVCHLVGEQLDEVSPLIRRRAAQEIERRILTPFMLRDDFWWMGMIRRDLNNWTPWIVSDVMLAAVAWMQDRLRLAEALERACRMLDRYLDVMPDDGGCDEGAAYWNVAGGSLLDCLDLLEYVTGGRMTFWTDEKVRGILSFPVKASLGGGWFVNFADCDARPWISGERLQLAGERLNDPALIALGVQMRTTAAHQLCDTAHCWRLLNELFHPRPAAVPELPEAHDVWLPRLQVRVLARGGAALSAKGGHNGESHNHNDVGSFLLYLDGVPAVVDAGNLIYTAKTFSEARYEIWNTRTKYHNLPLIGGCEQLAGEQYRAEAARPLPEGMTVSLASAYDPAAEVTAFERTLTLDADGVMTLTDEIACGKAQTVAWGFLLRHQPTVSDGRVAAGNVLLDVPEGLQAVVEEIPVTDARLANNYPGSLWRLTLTAQAAKAHRQTFVFRRA